MPLKPFPVSLVDLDLYVKKRDVVVCVVAVWYSQSVENK